MGPCRIPRFVQIHPAPHYLFIEQDATNRELYERGKAITEIFALGGTGIVTKRDSLTVQFPKDAIWSVVQKFAALAPEEVKEDLRTSRRCTRLEGRWSTIGHIAGWAR